MFVRCREVVRFSEGPLWEVRLYKMARDEAQHGTFSEPTRTGIHTTTQRGTVPSCIDMIHRRKRTAWLLAVWLQTLACINACASACAYKIQRGSVWDRTRVVGGGETQQELIPFKHKEWSVVDLVLSELTVTGLGALR